MPLAEDTEDAEERTQRGMDGNEIGGIVVGAAIDVHRELGPGLLESVYEAVLVHELRERGLSVERQVSVPIVFRSHHFDEGFRADVIVEGKVILELKSVEKVKTVHKKQLLSYLKLSRMNLGYILNFGEELMKDGITRIIHSLPERESPGQSNPGSHDPV